MPLKSQGSYDGLSSLIARNSSTPGVLYTGFRDTWFHTIHPVIVCLFVAVFVFTSWGCASTASAEEEIFVTDNYKNLRAYDRLATGKTSPKRTLRIAGLPATSGVAIDALHNEVYVANRRIGSITVYDRFARGTTSPKRVISGAHTQLKSPRGLAVDTTHGKLLVVDELNNKILIYPLAASGDITPQVIAGTATQLKTPWGIVVDAAHNELFVSNYGNGLVAVYDLAAAYKINFSEPANMTPLRIVRDLESPMDPRGIAIDVRNDELIVVSHGNSTIAVYPRTANGDTRPKRRLSGPATGLNRPLGIALDVPNDELLVSNLRSHSITAFTRTAQDNTPPLRILKLADDREPVFLSAITGILLQVRIGGDGIGTITSEPPGVDCSTGNNDSETCQVRFAVNSHVTLMAAGRSYFSGWGGDCAGAGIGTTCVVTMGAEKRVTASFVVHSLTVAKPIGTPDLTTSGGTVRLAVETSDSLHHPLTYSWSTLCSTALGSNGRFDSPNNHTPIWTAPTNTTGKEQSCTITVKVSDGYNLSNTQSYAQRIKALGTPPRRSP